MSNNKRLNLRIKMAMSMMMIMMMIMVITFTRMHALPSSLITCDLTIPKYKTITEERSAIESCSQMFTVFGLSSEQVFLIHQSRSL